MAARPVAALVIAAGLIGVPTSLASASQPCPRSDASITVTAVDGSQSSLSATQVCNASDVFDAQYFTRASADGAETPVPVQQGLSVHTLLDLLGTDSTGASFIAIPRADGTWSTLTNPSDLSDPSDFQGGLLPVFRVTSNGIDYLRPLRSDDDVNSEDYFATTSDGSFDVQLHSGVLLTVSASADPSTTKIGKPVRFAAAVTRPPAASLPLSYSWSFGDGAHATGATTSHGYSDAGGFEAQVTVTGADGSGGVSGEVPVTISLPTPPPSTAPTPGSGGHHHPHRPTRPTGPSGPPKSTGHSGATPPTTHSSNDNGALVSRADGDHPPSGTTITIPPSHIDAGANRRLVGTKPQIALGATDVDGRLLGGVGGTLSSREVATLTAPAAPAAFADVPTSLGAGFAALGLVIVCIGLGALRQLASNERDSNRLSRP